MKTHVVITTINPVTKALQAICDGCKDYEWGLQVVGDVATPQNFKLSYGNYWQVDPSSEDKLLRSYARKNLGYLTAAKQGAEVIVDVDDDGYPLGFFWQDHRSKFIMPSASSENGWVNAYQLFTNKNIWPRGFPLEYIKNNLAFVDLDKPREIYSPYQQYLMHDNPDVDAIYRLTGELPFSFSPAKREAVAISPHSWCPFNSQNTVWFKEAFPLMYLPAHCSARVADIWRGLIAQRIGWEYGWQLSFFLPTLLHERNHHDLMDDFREELPLYQNVGDFRTELEDLDLKGLSITEALETCYAYLDSACLIETEDTNLVHAWVKNIESIYGRDLVRTLHP